MNKKIILISGLITVLSLLIFLGARLKAETTSLTIARDPGASAIGSRVAVPTGGSVDFNVFYITNNTASPVSVDSIKVTRTGGADNYFTAIALFLKQPNGTRTQIGTNQTLVAGTTYFSTLNLSILGNSSSTIYISAIIWGGAKNGDSIGLGISSPGDIYPSVAASVAGTVAPVMRTVDTGGADTTPPAAPTNIKVESVGTEPTIKISWTDPTDSDLLKIVVYRSGASGQLGTVNYLTNRGVGIIPTTSFEDKNITVGTTYYYTVKAVDIANNESTNTTQYNAVAYAKGLNIFLDTSSPAAGNINASSSDVSLAAFKFVASNVEAVASNLRINGIGDSRNIKSLKLFSGGTLIETKDNSANISASTSQTIDFSFLTGTTSITIAANTSKIISFKADIPASARNNDKLALSIKSLTAQQDNGVTLNVYGLNISANTQTITGGATPSPSASPSPSPSVSPFPSASPSVSPSPSPSPTPSPSASLGVQLLRAANSEKVYRIVDGKKLWIPTAEAFNVQGLKWSDVQEVAEAQINQYPRLALLQATGDYRVYYITESGLKRHIPSAKVFLSYGNKWENIVKMSADVLNSYPDNNLIKLQGSTKIYKLENGKKCWVQTASAFLRQKFDWSKIAPVNAIEFNFYPTDTSITDKTPIPSGSQASGGAG